MDSIIAIAANYGLPTLILLALAVALWKIGGWIAGTAFPGIMEMWKRSIQTQDRANKALVMVAEVLEQNSKAFTLIVEVMCREKER